LDCAFAEHAVITVAAAKEIANTTHRRLVVMMPGAARCAAASSMCKLLGVGGIAPLRAAMSPRDARGLSPSSLCVVII
jgi:hypothetical protein